MQSHVKNLAFLILANIFLTPAFSCDLSTDCDDGVTSRRTVSLPCETDRKDFENRLRVKYISYCRIWRSRLAVYPRVRPGILFLEDLIRQHGMSSSDQEILRIDDGVISRIIDTLLVRRVEGVEIGNAAERTLEEQRILARCVWSLMTMKRGQTTSAPFTGRTSDDPSINSLFEQTRALLTELGNQPQPSYLDYIKSDDFAAQLARYGQRDQNVVHAFRYSSFPRDSRNLFLYFTIEGLGFLETNRAWLSTFAETDLKSSLEIISFYNPAHLNFLTAHHDVLDGANAQEKNDILWTLIYFRADSLTIFEDFYDRWLKGKTPQEKISALKEFYHLVNSAEIIRYILTKQYPEVD